MAGIFVLFIGIILLPESPKFYYSKQLYKESRESLAYIAKINGNNTYSTLFLFDNEVESEERIEELIEERIVELIEEKKEEIMLA